MYKVDQTPQATSSSSWTNNAQGADDCTTQAISDSSSWPAILSPTPLSALLTISSQSGVCDVYADPPVNRPATVKVTGATVPLWVRQREHYQSVRWSITVPKSSQCRRPRRHLAGKRHRSRAQVRSLAHRVLLRQALVFRETLPADLHRRAHSNPLCAFARRNVEMSCRRAEYAAYPIFLDSCIRVLYKLDNSNRRRNDRSHPDSARPPFRPSRPGPPVAASKPRADFVGRRSLCRHRLLDDRFLPAVGELVLRGWRRRHVGDHDTDVKPAEATGGGI